MSFLTKFALQNILEMYNLGRESTLSNKVAAIMLNIVVVPFLRNGTTTKSREFMENHKRENSEEKSSKYWWFMVFSELRMGKYHYNYLYKRLLAHVVEDAMR